MKKKTVRSVAVVLLALIASGVLPAAEEGPARFLRVGVFLGNGASGYSGENAVEALSIDPEIQARRKEESALLDRLLYGSLAERITATGFVNGSKLEGEKGSEPWRVQLLQTWLDAGFELGNHTFWAARAWSCRENPGARSGSCARRGWIPSSSLRNPHWLISRPPAPFTDGQPPLAEKQELLPVDPRIVV